MKRARTTFVFFPVAVDSFYGNVNDSVEIVAFSFEAAAVVVSLFNLLRTNTTSTPDSTSEREKASVSHV